MLQEWRFGFGPSEKFAPEFRGKRNNLISLDGGSGKLQSVTVQFDNHEKDPQWTYKLLYQCGVGVCLAASGDGLSFTSWNDGKPITGRGADTYNALTYDTDLAAYILYSRRDYETKHGWRDIRGHRMLLNRNLHKTPGVWEPVKDWFLDLSGNAESHAHHIYALTSTRLGSLHLGLATILKYPRDCGEGGLDTTHARHDRDVSEVHLVTSRNGVHWDLRWIYTAPPLIRRGPIASWDSGCMCAANQIITVNGSHWLFYSGTNERHHHIGMPAFVANSKEFNSLSNMSTTKSEWHRKLSKVSGSIGLAMLPTNQLVGFSPTTPDLSATLMTHAFISEGEYLILNARLEPGGYVVVHLLHEQEVVATNAPISADNQVNMWCQPKCTTNGVCASVQSVSLQPCVQKSVITLIDQPVELKFVIFKATLFSFQITNKATP